MTTQQARPSMSGGTRWPAPDATRGFMLLLIAVANAPHWLPASAKTYQEYTPVDQIWVLVRSLLVDQREYPLFAVLLGFGCAVLAARLRAQGQRAEEISSLIRFRGFWLMAFGLVHSFFFPGDILGAYGLVLVALAPVLADPKRYRAVAWVTGITVFLVSMVTLFWIGAVNRFSIHDPSLTEPHGIEGVLNWLLNSPLTVLTSMIVPAAILGAVLPSTRAAEWLQEPQRHRRALTLAVALLTPLSVAGALQWGIGASAFMSDRRGFPFEALMIHVSSGVLGAFAWLALISLITSWREPHALTKALAKLGSSSLTAYLLLTPLLYGGVLIASLVAPVSQTTGIIVGVASWAIVLLFAQSRFGGVLDDLMKKLVLSTHYWLSPVSPASPEDQEPPNGDDSSRG